MKVHHGFKFIKSDMTSRNGDSGVWVLGKWKKCHEALVMCGTDFHASPTPLDSLEYVYGEVWTEVEARGEVLEDGDKFAASEMRIVRILDQEAIFRRFAIACAKRCLPNFEEKYPDDARPRKAIEAAEAFLKNPTDANRAARSAAWSAAWSAEREWQTKTLLSIIEESA